MSEFEEAIRAELWSSLRNAYRHLGLYETTQAIVETGAEADDNAGKVLLAALQDRYE